MSLPSEAYRRLKLLGAEMDVVTAEDVVAFTARCVHGGRKAIVANHNTHSLFLIRKDSSMRQCYAMADIIEIDSMPLIAWGKAVGAPLKGRHRSTYLDWRGKFWRRAQAEGWRVFYLGGKPGVAQKAAANLRRRFRGIAVEVAHGYFDRCGPANEAMLDKINAFAPDVLFVGLGMPDQERWIAANYQRLDRGVVFSVGGAFDYEAGVQIAAPRWLAAIGFEWLFRFATQPRRLFGRYFVEPWSLLPAAVEDLSRAWSIVPKAAPLTPSAGLEFE